MGRKNLSIKVGAEGDGLRLDRFLATHEEFKDVSRAHVQRLIEDGKVLLNQKVAKSKAVVDEGDVVTVHFVVQPPASILTPKKLDLEILHEDDDLLVVNKPPGLVVHPGAGTKGTTLVEALLHHTKGRLSQTSAAQGRPGIVHRLDKDTSGVIVVAKTDIAHAFLAKQFENKTSYREYWALLDGLLPRKTVMRESIIIRDPRHRIRFKSKEYDPEEGEKTITSGKYAKSTFTVSKVFGGRLTLCKVVLATGRTHQIRVHAVDLRAPVVGDLTYHRKVQLPSVFPKEIKEFCGSIKRQMLHAKVLRFTHPTTKKDLSFETNLPKDFEELLETLAPYESLSY